MVVRSGLHLWLRRRCLTHGRGTHRRGIRIVVRHRHTILPPVAVLVDASLAKLDFLVKLDLGAGETAEGGPAIVVGGAGDAVLLTKLCALTLDVAVWIIVSIWWEKKRFLR
jgi:hypothetical protein